jgi:SAM-dependent methyltransferase
MSLRSWLREKLKAHIVSAMAEVEAAQQAKAMAEVEEFRHDLLMPKYEYHSPMDYSTESHPPVYEPAISIAGVELPVPPPKVRPGYSPDDDQHYLAWGKADHDRIVGMIKQYGEHKPEMTILDWGCSSGRVLRHFHEEHKQLHWRLLGTDIQAFLIQWMRQYFPPEFEVICGMTIPHLPYPDRSIDVIYGISVFTHTKYLWDLWLTEFQRVLKPGGLLIQTVQCERAWRFYHQNRHLDWVKGGHPQWMLDQPEIPQDFFLYGDAFISQTFFKEAVIRKYWGRILDVAGFEPPAEGHYQDWIICKAR